MTAVKADGFMSRTIAKLLPFARLLSGISGALARAAAAPGRIVGDSDEDAALVSRDSDFSAIEGLTGG
jgi:hypothetical protein